MAKKKQRNSKQERERRVLLALVELFIKEGKPVGSNTLRSAGVQDLSSATLRNYFVDLEAEGFLTQQHSSGGRIPTAKAYREYVNYCLEEPEQQLQPLNEQDQQRLDQLRNNNRGEIGSLLEQGAELLSDLTRCAVFLSAPRFDHDFVRDLKLVSIDENRCLCVIVTSFGLVKSEVLRTEGKISAFSLKRMEAYFHWRLTGQDKPEELTEEEHDLAQRLYNEALVRYIVGYSNIVDEEIYRTGCSQLLRYEDFSNVASLAGALSLFENPQAMRLMLRDCMSNQTVKAWVGDELPQHGVSESHCSLVAIPYSIGPKAVGGVGVLGPLRLPYRELIEILRRFTDALSDGLTNNVYQYSITYRQPLHHLASLEEEQRLLLEDKSND